MRSTKRTHLLYIVVMIAFRAQSGRLLRLAPTLHNWNSERHLSPFSFSHATWTQNTGNTNNCLCYTARQFEPMQWRMTVIAQSLSRGPRLMSLCCVGVTTVHEHTSMDTPPPSPPPVCFGWQSPISDQKGRVGDCDTCR
ncbi:hypothetical protein N0V93_001020 [Gnomoniopsis smithogilvyi]|uniref:Secreted protein n=1 Tax=Gnomoniopsis smithogilvyi TaxID=1191159 RepID=A0A9W9D1A3_9PEZI|nr:hypothetical protein N0V93_001020 [Gnomoniopsis smithogilvyi]